MAVASIDDVVVALGRPASSDAEEGQIDWWLDGVELVIATRLGDVAALNQDVLRRVEVEAVVAKLQRAGRQESSVTVSVDDGSVTRRYENPVTASDITDLWWTLLGTPRSRGGSMTVSGGWMLRR